MKVIDSIKTRLTRLLTAPGEELGSWARFVRFQIHLWRHCARRLGENNAMAMSSALSFRTIFALVPALILALLVLRTFGVAADSKQVMRELFRHSGLSQLTYAESRRPSDDDPWAIPIMQPQDSSVTVAETIESLVDRVEKQLTLGRLGPIGAVLLIWTALTLLTTIERSLNRVFGAPRSRSLLRRLLLYWSVVTLGPVLLMSAGYLGNKIAASFGNHPALSWTVGAIGWVGPIVVGILLLAALYSMMPNTQVRFRVAVEGALVAIPLWLVAKWGFAQYVEHVGRRSLYGAIGLLPLFLMWLNLSWWIFLFGAEVAHTAANLSRMVSADRDERVILTPWHVLAAVLAVARSQSLGRGPAAVEKISTAANLGYDVTERLLGRLTAEGILCHVADETGQFVLARPAAKIPVAEILRIGSAEIAGERARSGGEVDRAVAEVRRRIEADVEHLTIEDALGD